MARKPVSVFTRPTSKKGQNRYYIKIWDEALGVYSSPRSAAMVAQELQLDPKAFPPTSRTGALLIGEELRRRGGGASGRKTSPNLADYLAEFWDWEKSTYIKSKIARGQRIGKEYVSHNASYVEMYIRPAFPRTRLAAVRPYMLEDFTMNLKQDSGLGNRSVNAILSALTVPLHEAARLGLIDTDPAASIRLLGNDSAEKGIPTEDEIRGLLTLQGLDPRIHAAIMLGAAAALRLGEMLALTIAAVGKKTIIVSGSWSKVDGLKDTKTGRVRVIPCPDILHKALVALDAANPHGKGGFLLYGAEPDAPIDCRWIERGFDDALVQLSLGDKYATATKKEKTEALAAWRERRISLHSLRHWANAMLRGSISDEKLRLLTGHSTEAMTSRYDHATEADLADLAQAQEMRLVPFFKAKRTPTKTPKGGATSKAKAGKGKKGTKGA